MTDDLLSVIPQMTGLNDQIYDILRDAILRKTLAPGERLDVGQLAERWGVSRTPVSSALQRLLAEGLVEVIPRKGTFVSNISPKEVLEMLDVRLMFELRAAELAMERVTDNQLEKLYEILLKSDRLIECATLDYVTYTTMDIDFHCTLVSWAENLHMTKIYALQNFHWHTARLYYNNAVPKVLEGQKEHWEIFHAYERRSISGAKEVLTKHIQAGIRGIRELCK